MRLGTRHYSEIRALAKSRCPFFRRGGVKSWLSRGSRKGREVGENGGRY